MHILDKYTLKDFETHARNAYPHAFALVSDAEVYKFESLKDIQSSEWREVVHIAYTGPRNSKQRPKAYAVFQDGEVTYKRERLNHGIESAGELFPNEGRGLIQEHIAPFRYLVPHCHSIKDKERKAAVRQSARLSYELLVQFVHLFTNRINVIINPDRKDLLTDFSKLCMTIEQAKEHMEKEEEEKYQTKMYSDSESRLYSDTRSIHPRLSRGLFTVTENERRKRRTIPMSSSDSDEDYRDFKQEFDISKRKRSHRRRTTSKPHRSSRRRTEDIPNLRNPDETVAVQGSSHQDANVVLANTKDPAPADPAARSSKRVASSGEKELLGPLAHEQRLSSTRQMSLSANARDLNETETISLEKRRILAMLDKQCKTELSDQWDQEQQSTRQKIQTLERRLLEQEEKDQTAKDETAEWRLKHEQLKDSMQNIINCI